MATHLKQADAAPAADYRFIDIISGHVEQLVSGNSESGAGRLIELIASRLREKERRRRLIFDFWTWFQSILGKSSRDERTAVGRANR